LKRFEFRSFALPVYIGFSQTLQSRAVGSIARAFGFGKKRPESGVWFSGKDDFRMAGRRDKNVFA